MRLATILTLIIVPLFVSATGSLAFSAWSGQDVKNINAYSGIMQFKETGQIEVMNESAMNFFYVTGPNGISHYGNGKPPGTDGKLGTVYSMDGVIVYDILIKNIIPGDWVKIQFNITSLSNVGISIGQYTLTFAPSSQIFMSIDSHDFLPTGIFGSNGAYWLYNISGFHPGIMQPQPHHQFTFKFYFGLASNAPVSASGSDAAMKIIIPIEA
ncbi:MAG: hypothetical protein QXP70_02040 [Methanomassiliicoccales archaeon]